MSEKSASSNSGKTKATTVEAPSVASSARPPPPPPSAYGAGHGGADPEIVRRSLERLVAGDLSSPNPAVVKSDADKDSAAASASFLSEQSAASTEVAEYNNWASEAEEDVKKGLARLFTLALDEHKADAGKGVQQYYSERLAKLLKEADTTFDCSYLH